MSKSPKASWLLATCLLTASAGAQAGPPPGASQVDIRQQRYMGLDQLLKVLDLSPRAYELQDTNQVGRAGLVERMYPRRVAPVDHPWRGPEGTAPVAPFPIKKGAARKISAGERHIEAGRLVEAKAAFEAALSLQPNAYPATLGLGQLELRHNRPALALGLFHQAKVHNPDDPLTHRLLGDAAAARRLTEQARAHYVQALARRPRDGQALSGLARIGLSPPRDLFLPRAAAKKQRGRIGIYYDATVPASRIWWAWAAARAAWMGEPELRLRFGGTAQSPDWSTPQELFCLACLLGHYLKARQSSKNPPLPDLERLLKIQKRSMLTEYVLYAIGSRLDPNAPLMLPADGRKRMEAFVDLFVVPPVSGAGP